MSSIAEFYSRNLATEVHKGMSQKAKTGGTPGKAPLGYLNVGHRTPEGREERTVEIDPERAELITWAFMVFATGEWTLRSLADELETRGLTTRRTPKLPSLPVKPNVQHAILTNPYYKCEVVYRGVTHQGTHQPLIDPLTWQRVQDVLASHLIGERQRDHPHYLKSSVYCGACGSRLIITNAKNRYGIVYPYFVCLGRHMKITTCTRKAMLIAKVEKMVEDHWATIRLDPALRDAVEEGLRTELATRRHEAEREHKHLASEKAKLTTQRHKLVEAIYSGAMPLDLTLPPSNSASPASSLASSNGSAPPRPRSTRSKPTSLVLSTLPATATPLTWQPTPSYAGCSTKRSSPTSTSTTTASTATTPNPSTPSSTQTPLMLAEPSRPTARPARSPWPTSLEGL